MKNKLLFILNFLFALNLFGANVKKHSLFQRDILSLFNGEIKEKIALYIGLVDGNKLLVLNTEHYEFFKNIFNEQAVGNLDELKEAKFFYASGPSFKAAMVDGQNFRSNRPLENIEISDWQNLEKITIGAYLPLKGLSIHNCPNLKEIIMPENDMYYLLLEDLDLECLDITKNYMFDLSILSIDRIKLKEISFSYYVQDSYDIKVMVQGRPFILEWNMERLALVIRFFNQNRSYYSISFKIGDLYYIVFGHKKRSDIDILIANENDLQEELQQDIDDMSREQGDQTIIRDYGDFKFVINPPVLNQEFIFSYHEENILNILNVLKEYRDIYNGFDQIRYEIDGYQYLFVNTKTTDSDGKIVIKVILN